MNQWAEFSMYIGQTINTTKLKHSVYACLYDMAPASGVTVLPRIKVDTFMPVIYLFIFK